VRNTKFALQLYTLDSRNERFFCRTPPLIPNKTSKRRIEKDKVRHVRIFFCIDEADRHRIVNSFFSWFYSPSGSRHPPWNSSITLKTSTLSRTPLEESSDRRRKHPVGFEPLIPASERP